MFHTFQSSDLFPNEFSRTIQPSRVLKNKRSGFHTMKIVANEQECADLAKRFALSDISSLGADVVLRPEWIGTSVSNGVEVEGSCQATVTQRCVRTNEEFVVDLNFPVYCIVRPVLPMGQEVDEAPSLERTRNINMSDLDALQLQKMLIESDETEDLMEDENIYVVEGSLDVGELISQLFWLKLDPYPKKPGTDPIQRSITG